MFARKVRLRRKQIGYIRTLFACPPAFDNIFHHIGPGDLFRLSRTCLEAFQAVRLYIPHAFNIDFHLSRYFSNTDGFRLLQARTETIISGSSALQFLDRTIYPGSDLDLYVTQRHTMELGNYLMNEEGYSYSPVESRPEFKFDEEDLKDNYQPNEDYNSTSLCAVFEFRKADKRIQVIVAKHSTFHCIISFHSTCVMNLITYEAAYSLYPRATFDERKALAGPLFTVKEEVAIKKYMARGWTITHDAQYPFGLERMKKMFFLDSPRCVLDRHVWCLPLSQLDFPSRKYSPLSPEIDFDPSVVNCWTLTSGNTFLATTKFFIVSAILKNRYTWAGRDLFPKVMDFLQKQGRLQFHVMDTIEDEKEQEELWTWWDAALYSLYRDHFSQ